MINRKLFGTLVLALAILSLANVAAFADGSRHVQLNNPASLSGTQLDAGKYKVSWETRSPEVAGPSKASLEANHPDVTVTFSKGNKVLVTAHGRLVDRAGDYNRDAVVYRTNPDGSLTITEIRFRNLKQVIVLDQ